MDLKCTGVKLSFEDNSALELEGAEADKWHEELGKTALPRANWRVAAKEARAQETKLEEALTPANGFSLLNGAPSTEDDRPTLDAPVPAVQPPSKEPFGPLARRIFIAVDEWLGIVLLMYLHATESPVFWRVFVCWALGVYAFGYIPYWLRYDRWWKR